MRGAIYLLPQPSTLRRNTRMITATETPAQSGRAFNPTFITCDRSPFGPPRHAARHFARHRADSSRDTRGFIMAMPAILSGDSLTRLLQGAAAGAIATLIVGFYWGGWVTGSTAKDMVQRSTSSAVITALSPICVDKFQHSPEVATNMVELKKVASYQQGS